MSENFLSLLLDVRRGRPAHLESSSSWGLCVTGALFFSTALIGRAVNNGLLHLLATVHEHTQTRSLRSESDVGSAHRFSVGTKLIRVSVLLMALFVTVDAGLCPVLCLYADSAGHGSTNVPSQAATSSACGVCSCGLVAAAPGLPSSLTPLTKRVTPYQGSLPPLAPAFDIEHPPRLS